LQSEAGLTAQRQPLDRVFAVEPNVIEVLARKALFALNDEDIPAAASFVRRINESTMKHSGWLENDPSRDSYSLILPAAMYVSADFTGAYQAIQDRLRLRSPDPEYYEFDIPFLFAVLEHTGQFTEVAAQKIDRYCQNNLGGRQCDFLTGKISPASYDSAEETDWPTKQAGWVVGEWYLLHGDRVSATRVFADFIAWSQRNATRYMCNYRCLPKAIAAQEVRWLAAPSPAQRRRR